MNCLVCARAGNEHSAVAICPHCSAGLCLGHVTEAAWDPGPGGMRLTCGHRTWDPPRVGNANATPDARPRGRRRAQNP